MIRANRFARIALRIARAIKIGISIAWYPNSWIAPKSIGKEQVVFWGEGQRVSRVSLALERLPAHRPKRLLARARIDSVVNPGIRTLHEAIGIHGRCSV